MAIAEFAEWLQEALTDKGMSKRDLALKAGLDPGIITRAMKMQRLPSTKSLGAIAKALDYPEETVLRIAGKISSQPPDDQRVENWREILRLLTPEEEAELREIGLLKIRRRDAASRLNQARKQHPRDYD